MQLESYSILNPAQLQLYQNYQEDPNHFSTTDGADASRRRETKIVNFKWEKRIKEKLAHLRANPAALQNDDTKLRELYITDILLSANQTFQALEAINQELSVLASIPPTLAGSRNLIDSDHRTRSRNEGDYSERLDTSLSQVSGNGLNGPILSSDGRPLQPFTLLDSRQRIAQDAFRPGHSLPTMTIDEYLEEEKRRGGFINGGGPKSQQKASIDEDNFEKEDERTVKARAWDEFAEENPRGSGNTLNLG